MSQAEWVKEPKRVSNVWIKNMGGEFTNFQWQAGYAAFSVSQPNLLHLEFDERYVWD